MDETLEVVAVSHVLFVMSIILFSADVHGGGYYTMLITHISSCRLASCCTFKCRC